MLDKLLTPHFRTGEFRCKCRRPDCSAPAMDPGFMQLLEALRMAYGKPLIITSGSRCPTWNAQVGGATDSEHMQGRAADLHLADEDEIGFVAMLAEKLGFGGIGKGEINLLHVDTGPGGRRWTYYGK